MQHKQANNRMKCANLVLVGLMGSGKSTLGRALAKKLGMEFVDSDIEIQNRTGVSIQHIFDVEGELGFRQREAQVIAEIMARRNVVLATGGGAILDAQSRSIMRERGIVFYLEAQASELWQRTKHDKNRPLLKVENQLAKLTELLTQREELYRETADISLHTGRQSVNCLMMCAIKKLDEFKCRMNMEIPNVQTLRVELNDRGYPIYIGAGLLEYPHILEEYIPKRRVAIVSNTTVAPLYLNTLVNSISSLGVDCSVVILPDGESFKTAATLETIYDGLLKNRCERTTPIIALGGGVIGDMSGFAAATYQRGVPFIQIPTTLLSQVDSSVGGKTGINHPLGKNMIGAFYQPQLVIIDTSTLATLPARELSAGISEIIKYGLIRDLPFLEWLECNMEYLLQRDSKTLEYAIHRSCQNKASVVGADERESGERALLNLGHTFGHAIESGMGYGAWLHGEAVAAGTVMAADLSRRMGWLERCDVDRIKKLFKRANLPTIAPKLGVERYIQLMGLDKKVESGKIRFVLLKALGRAVIESEVPQEILEQTIESCTSD